MSDAHKYYKYKQKYILAKKLYCTTSDFARSCTQKGGIGKKIIMLDGTSSSGKSTISREFEKDGWIPISLDDVRANAEFILRSTMPNEYITMSALMENYNNTITKLMFDEYKKHTDAKIIFDVIDQNLLKYIERDKIFIVVVYSPLKELVRNVVSRKSTQPRGKYVFTQYSEKYIRTDDSIENLDVVNRRKFIKYLKNVKDFFESEEDLIKFANRVFSKMNIDDDDNHFIKLRPEIQYDYILNTKKKTPIEKVDELKKILK